MRPVSASLGVLALAASTWSSMIPRSRALLLVGLAGLLACGGGASGTRFPGAAASCLIGAVGADVVAARCIETPSARINAVRVDGAGDVIVVGTFRGHLAFDPSRPIASTGQLGQAFVAKLGADLTPRFALPLDAPGAVRGVVTSTPGVAVVTAAVDPPEGPFLTQLDGAGNVVLRRNLAFGGLVSGVANDASGALVLRVQQDGLRLVVVSRDGNVLASPRVSPSWIAQFPASVTGDALVPDVAFGPDGAYVVHARGPSEDGVLSDQALTKLGPNGAFMWSRPVPVGANAQVVAMGGGVAVLTPQAGAICPGAIGRSFAVTALDGEANVRWLRCFSARAADLHVATDTSGHVVVAGSMADSGDLGDGLRRVPPKSVASFVVRLGDRGETRKVAILSGPAIVAIHGIAPEPGGGVVVTGLGASNAGNQTHVFVATLRN